MTAPSTTASDLCLRSLGEVSERIRRHELSPLELTEATLRRIELLNPKLNCYLSVAGDIAVRRATELTAALAAGRYLGPLHGIPVSLKDNIDTVDLPTTAGSPALATRRPVRPAAVVQALEDRGAVIVGKCHLYELAYGAPHARYGEIRNPWNLAYSCGGSSSGSAAAVAAGLCHGSIGTDTGGSIRIPASLCGIVGFKPTFGVVDRTGVVPISSNLDHVGPMARTARDVALLFAGIADRQSPIADRPAATDALEAGIDGLRIGFPERQQAERIDPEVMSAVDGALKVLEQSGAELREVRLPNLAQAETVMWVISSVEAAEVHGRLVRDHSAELHPLVLELLKRGERISGTDYVHAQRVRQTMIDQMRELSARVDAVVLPTTAITAFPVGAETLLIDGREEHVQPAMNRYTPLFDLTGGPAVSLPCGVSSSGLPIGLQVGGRPFGDWTVLRVAHAYERVAGSLAPPATLVGESA